MSKPVNATEPNRSANQYIVNVINAKRAMPIGIRDHRIKALLEAIRVWAGNQLDDIFVTGSSAKGTSVKGNSDLDLFVSLRASSTNTLKVIYASLYKHLSVAGFAIEKRNVALRVRYWNLQIDIVPGKKLPDKTHWHYIYPNRWADADRIQTNVHKHVNVVLDSGRVNEIIALKIWRNNKKLEFPSMYLEMYVLKALSGKWSGKAYLADNFLYVLDHISKYFLSTAVYDPCNTTNVISNSLYKYEKEAIRAAAENSLKRDYLFQIVS